MTMAPMAQAYANTPVFFTPDTMGTVRAPAALSPATSSASFRSSRESMARKVIPARGSVLSSPPSPASAPPKG